MTAARTAVAVALLFVLLIVALFAAVVPFLLIGYAFATGVDLVSDNEALLLIIVVTGLVSGFAALLCILRFVIALLTPRLILPRVIPFARIGELANAGFSVEALNVMRRVLVDEHGVTRFDYVSVTKNGTVGAIVSWGARILVINPLFLRIFTTRELEAVLLHECGHVQSGIPFPYLIARQINAALHLMGADIEGRGRSWFHTTIDVVTWFVPPPAGRSLLRGGLKVAALPLLGVTRTMGALIVGVFRTEFHAAERDADRFVEELGRAGDLSVALVKLAAFRHIVDRLGLQRTVPVADDWNALVREFERVEEEAANRALPTLEAVLYEALYRATTTHPSTKSRIDDLGDVGIAAFDAVPIDVIVTVEEEVSSWLKRAAGSIADEAGALALGIVDDCSPTLQVAAETYRKSVEVQRAEKRAVSRASRAVRKNAAPLRRD